MTISVDELAHSYTVRFPYNARMVEDIKTIPGRQFRKDLNNAWMVPKSSAKAFQRFLDKWSGKAAARQVAAPALDTRFVSPGCIKTPLWPHQLEALRYLWNREAALIHLPMGTGGKSKIIVDYVCNKPDVRKVLVVCPLSVVPVWPLQFQRHGGKPVKVLPLNTGSLLERCQATRRFLAQAREVDRDTPRVVVANFEAVWRDAPEFVVAEEDEDYDITRYAIQAPVRPYIVQRFADVPGAVSGARGAWTMPVTPESRRAVRDVRQWWTQQTAPDGPEYSLADCLVDADFDLLVIDECHRAKAPGGKASNYLYRLGRAIPQRVGLSGTPFSHSPLDAYGVYRVLDPVIFGTSFTKFKQEYAELGGFGGYQVLGYKNLDGLREQIDRIRFHCEPSGIELPETIHTDIPVELDPSTLELYRQLENDFYAEVDTGVITAANAAVKLIRLQQLTSGYAVTHETDADDIPSTSIRVIDTTKHEAIVDFISDIPAEEPVVIFCRFVYDIDQLVLRLKKAGRSVSELSGRSNTLAQWQAGETSILVSQLQSGSTGIDLTRSRICIYSSYTFALAEYEQSLARIHRPGQTRTCLFYHFVVPASIDDTIRQALQARKDVLTTLLARRPTHNND